MTDSSASREVRRAYQRYLDAAALPTPNGVHSADALRAMQAAMLDALRSSAPLPDEMRLHLACAFEYLCAGIEFDLLMPVPRPGGREPPVLKWQQEPAIRYLRWVANDQLVDEHPLQTVARAYAVTDRAVRGWLQKWGDRPTPALAEGFGADAVFRFMTAGGAAYQRLKRRRVGDRGGS